MAQRLATLFRTHPAWKDAASRIAEGATSAVWFSHLPGERYRLERRGGESLLLPGGAGDPDFAFCFTPGSVARLEAVRGGIGEFAVALFECILDEDTEAQVGLRIVAPFHRLAWRGYLRLVLDAGPAVLRFGAEHGVPDLRALRRLVAGLRSRPPEPWER